MPLDTAVVGAGPNGLAAAIALAQAGRSVTLYEAKETVGGGTRSAELTLPGFIHDVCSAVHPLAVSSPFFAGLSLHGHGLEWVHPGVPLAHPLDDGGVAVLDRSLEETARGLGRDGPRYRRLMAPLAGNWRLLADGLLRPVLSSVEGPLLGAPRHPLLLARFGCSARRSAAAFARSAFAEDPARALLAGMAAHAAVPLERAFTTSFALVLAVAGHAAGWPFARGGSQRIADALASCLQSLGGQIVTGRRIHSIEEVAPALATLLDVTPAQLLRLVGDRLPGTYGRKLAGYRYGPGVFKLDYALDDPIPWRAEACARAGTVHLGGTLDEIAASLRAVDSGEHPEHPFVILAQPSLFDPTRAPEGKHTAWAYCHVPNGSPVDMTGRIEEQIERFAPGFRRRIIARSAMSPADLERYNENYIGGEIAGGAHAGMQLFFRPVLALNPYATPLRGIYLCSSSTPPGAGVHGMCGYWAARAALRGAGLAL